MFIGVNEPSAVDGNDTFFKMAHVLGVDEDRGEKICHGRYTFEETGCKCVYDKDSFKVNKGIYLTDETTNVIMAKDGIPCVTMHPFGKGKGVYMSSFKTNEENTRTLMNIILCLTGEGTDQNYITDNFYCECAYYPDGKQLVVINNSDTEQTTTVKTEFGDKTVTLGAFDTQIVQL